MQQQEHENGCFITFSVKLKLNAPLRYSFNFDSVLHLFYKLVEPCLHANATLTVSVMLKIAGQPVLTDIMSFGLA